MKKAEYLYMALAVLIFTAIPMLTFAQPDAPEDTPIDGGVSLLLAAGAAYGVKKYRDYKKKSGVEAEK